MNLSGSGNTIQAITETQKLCVCVWGGYPLASSNIWLDLHYLEFW